MKEKIVCVEWEDASFTSGYYDEDKPQDFTPVITHTVGHLVKRNKTSIIVSAERFYDHRGRVENDRRIETIPRKMIKKITYLRGVK